MKNMNVIKVLIVSLLMAVSFQSSGFWVGSGVNDVGGNIGIGQVHQNITANAAKDFKYIRENYPELCGVEGCSFTDKVIKILQASNKSIDGDELTKDDPTYHCDNEELQKCAGIIYNGRLKIRQVIIELANGIKEGSSNPAKAKEAQKLLGQISHTLQDFYSHSNWVEMEVEKKTGNTYSVVTEYSYDNSGETEELLGFYAPLISKDFEYVKTGNNDTCKTTTKILSEGQTTLDLHRLTSGYYEKRPDLHGIGNDGLNPAQISTTIQSAIDIDYYRSSDSVTHSFLNDNLLLSDALNFNSPYYILSSGIHWMYKKCHGDSCPEKAIQDISKIDNSLLFYYDSPKLTDTVEKCQHGHMLNNIRDSSLFTLKNNLHFGIAKDQPGRKHHKTAKLAATLATTNLIETIVNDVHKQAGYEDHVQLAILSFLGYEEVTFSISPSLSSLPFGASYSAFIIDGNGNEIANKNLQVFGFSPAFFRVPLAKYPYKVKLSSDGYRTAELTCPFSFSRFAPEVCLVPLKPLIKLNGESKITIKKSPFSFYQDPGVTPLDSHVRVETTIKSSTPSTDKEIKVYTYNAKDELSGATGLLHREVEIVDCGEIGVFQQGETLETIDKCKGIYFNPPSAGGGYELDTTPPTITLNGGSNITIIKGSLYLYFDSGATAIDDVDGEVLVSSSGTVNTNVSGTYKIKYTASDKAGNEDVAYRTVNVILDDIAPIIKLNGEANITFIKGAVTYTELYATATDNVDDLTHLNLSPRSPVVFSNTTEIGTYILTYITDDAAGNFGTVHRTIHILPPPVLAEVTSPAAGVALLHWIFDVSNVLTEFQGYEIYRVSSVNDQDELSLEKIKTINDIAQKETTITGLPEGEKAFFKIRTFSEEGVFSDFSVVNGVEIKSSKLNDTGITFSDNYPYSNNSTCTGVTSNQQDCAQGRDATHKDDSDGHAGFSFTKLDASGNDLGAEANVWSCVRDNVTGLIWEKKTDDGGIHDKDNTYRWGGVTALGREHAGRRGVYYDDWNTLVEGSNSNNLCGFNDWRVPDRHELLSIMDFGLYPLKIDTDYFPNTIDSRVWSSFPTVSQYDSDADNSGAWYTSFYYGTSDVTNRNDNMYGGGSVRLVRSGQ